MTLAAQKTFVYRKEVLFTRIENEIVLLHLESEFYFTLNETGARIWELLAQYSFDGLVQELMNEYEDLNVSTLSDFISELLDKELIECK